MKNMKTKVLSIIVLFTLAACGGTKEAKLEALKKQHDKVAQQIEQLEKEIAASGDSTAVDATGTFVSVQEVNFVPFNHYIEVQGKLDGDQNIAIYPETMGNLTHVYVKAGQHVNSGQVLASVNDASYQEQLKSLETNYELANETFLKQENLWKQQIGSEMQYLQSKSSKESLESQLEALKKQIDMTRIKSPISGVVEESMVKVGQAVSPAMPAFRVVNFSSLKVSADVAEAYNSKVNVGDNVVVYFPDIQKEIDAKITFCSKYINPTNRTFSVEAMLKGTGNFKANMVCVLRINDYQNNQAIVLPINVIRSDNKGQYILLATQENDQYLARKKAVQVGQVYNGQAEIVGGLEKGQKIITGGYLGLNEGEVVRF
jgi:RND family efflux transporter MFP subunit